MIVEILYRFCFSECTHKRSKDVLSSLIKESAYLMRTFPLLQYKIDCLLDPKISSHIIHSLSICYPSLILFYTVGDRERYNGNTLR